MNKLTGFEREKATTTKCDPRDCAQSKLRLQTRTLPALPPNAAINVS